jgi:hypothetical protein
LTIVEQINWKYKWFIKGILISALRLVLITLMLLTGITSDLVADSMTDRPRVLISKNELSRLKREIQTVPWKRAIYECEEKRPTGQVVGIKPSAVKWLGESVEIPARSGHMHHFYCDCGTRLQLPKDLKPHPDTGYKCPACGKVYRGEKFDAAVRWWMHNELAVAARNLALVYAIEGDKRFAYKAGEILLKYADAYPGPHKSLLEGGMMYQSLCEAVWSIPLAQAYDLIYDSGVLSEREKRKIENKLFRPIAQGLMDVQTHGNWESWHLAGVGVIGFAIGDSRLTEYAISRFKEQISNELGDDGLWPESVHAYHFYPLSAFLFLAEAAYHSGIDLYNWEAKPGKGLRAMFTAPLQYMYPNMQIPAINDGWFYSFIPLDLYELAYFRYTDPSFGWVLKEGYKHKVGYRQGIWALLYGKSLDREFKPPVFQSTNFPVLGIAILRSTNGNMLTFDYGPYLGHGQLDKMGITLFANGKVFCADYGTPGYGSKIMEWFASTPAHNTVVVDGKSQEPTKQGTLTCFSIGKDFDVAEAETAEAYPGVLHKRSVLRVGDNFVVIDHLQSEADHTYDWLLRCEGEFETHQLQTADKPLGYNYIKEKVQFATEKDWSLCCKSEGGGLLIFSPGLEPCLVTIGECPAETGARFVPLLVCRKFGREVRFISVLCPYKGKPDIRCSFAEGLITIEHDGFIDKVFIGEASSRPSLPSGRKYTFLRTNGSHTILTEVVEVK